MFGVGVDLAGLFEEEGGWAKVFVGLGLKTKELFSCMMERS